jgi:hypothetical protein
VIIPAANLLDDHNSRGPLQAAEHQKPYLTVHDAENKRKGGHVPPFPHFQQQHDVIKVTHLWEFQNTLQ